MPAQYTLRLPRSVPIGGLVLNQDDKPVSGAQVQVASGGSTSAEVPHITTQAAELTVTDAQGRWRIDRFSREALWAKDRSVAHLSLQALHPDYFQDVMHSYGTGAWDQVRTQLLAGEYVFRLARRVPLRGTVVDTNSQPVPNVKITVDNPHGPSPPEMTNQADGTFAMAPCRAGANWLRFEASGFALTKLEVDLKPDMAPMRVTLGAAKPLRLRIMARNGLPVPQATVTQRTFVEIGASAAASGRAQRMGMSRVLFSQQADPDGRVRWDSPPEDLLSLEVAAAGLRSTNVLLKADGEEHVITLAPALTVFGTVHDAATGEPIPHFTLSAAGTRAPGGQNIEFEGGQFRHVEENADGRTVRFKFEAEGYVPFVTREVQVDAGEVQFDIQMQAAASTKVTLLLPDGTPATNADLALVEPGGHLIVTEGGLRPLGSRNSRDRLSLDDQARFTLPPSEEGTWVVAAAPEGYAAASASALAAEPTVRLLPWGRIEGRCLAGGKPAAGASFRLATKTPIAQTLYDVEADENGHFTFPTVPPGNLTLSKWSARGTRQAALNPLAEVAIQPGETKTISVGAYTAAARLHWPEGMKRGADWSILAYYLKAQNAGPTGPGHRLAETAEGGLVAEDLTAGSYVVKVSIGGPPGSNGQGKFLLRAEAPFTVPAEPSSGTLDLGEIVLQRAD